MVWQRARFINGFGSVRLFEPRAVERMMRRFGFQEVGVIPFLVIQHDRPVKRGDAFQLPSLREHKSHAAILSFRHIDVRHSGPGLGIDAEENGVFLRRLKPDSLAILQHGRPFVCVHETGCIRRSFSHVHKPDECVRDGHRKRLLILCVLTAFPSPFVIHRFLRLNVRNIIVYIYFTADFSKATAWFMAAGS